MLEGSVQRLLISSKQLHQGQVLGVLQQRHISGQHDDGREPGAAAAGLQLGAPLEVAAGALVHLPVKLQQVAEVPGGVGVCGGVGGGGAWSADRRGKKVKQGLGAGQQAMVKPQQSGDATG
jgi:hypothetical protein